MQRQGVRRALSVTQAKFSIVGDAARPAVWGLYVGTVTLKALYQARLHAQRYHRRMRPRPRTAEVAQLCIS